MAMVERCTPVRAGRPVLADVLAALKLGPSLASDVAVAGWQDSAMVGLDEGAPAPCELWEGPATVSLGHG